MAPSDQERQQRLIEANKKRSIKQRGTANPNVRWSEEDVRTMRELYLLHRIPSTEIARRFGTYDGCVLKILTWKQWAHTDPDLRALPRPVLRGGRPAASPEERQAKRKLYRQRYRQRHQEQRRQQRTLGCQGCIQFIPKPMDCALAYAGVAASGGSVGRDCESFDPVSPSIASVTALASSDS